MKTRLAAISLISTVLLCATPSTGAHEPAEPHVRVSGTASTEAKPEVMIWHLRIENRGELLEDVAEVHQSLSARIVELIKEFKIPEKDIQSEGMQFGENWEYDQGRRNRDGYIASSQLTFKSDNLDLYNTIWKALSKFPELQVNNVLFDLTPESRINLQNESRRRALRAARQKAADMADTLDVRIGKPLVIEDLSQATDDFQPYAMQKNSVRLSGINAGAEGESISPGTIEVQQRVQVVFELLQ